MIEFVTLLLGLVIGPHPAAVAVGPEVRAVQWVLDGEVVAGASEEPWTAMIDFGEELKPRRLVVVAYNEDGFPIARAEQLVNYIRSNHEVAVVLQVDPDEPPNAKTGKRPPRRGRVVAKGVLGHGPVGHVLRFDGRELPVESSRFELPLYDSERPHAIEAEVTFSDGVVAKTETTFGGGLGEEVTSALSAIAVTNRKGKPWSTEDAKGWLRRDGRALPVFQTKADGGHIVIVRDNTLDMSILRNLPIPAGALNRTQGRRAYTLSAVSPLPITKPTTTFREAALGRVLSDQGLLLSLVAPLASYGFAAVGTEEQDLWGALAIAGRAAASSNMPRVVILMLGQGAEPTAGLSPQTILRYLESIHVPVLIWAPTRKPLKKLGLAKARNAYVSSQGLGSVVAKASTWVDSQTVVWLEGVHLPTEVELVADRKNVRFANHLSDR